MKGFRGPSTRFARWLPGGGKKFGAARYLACVGLILLGRGALPLVTRAQQANQETIPLIEIKDAPFNDVIKNLARQARLNYILDPKLEGGWDGASRRGGPAINARWENVTAQQALDAVLREQGLFMTANPATTIARIAFTNQIVKPVPQSAVAADTNGIIPLITMETVPLPDAFRNLAKQAHLNLMFDSNLPVPSAAPVKRTISDYNISVRWENVTARQALAAILDNYDLMLVEDPVIGTGKLAPKPTRNGTTQ